MFNIVKTCKEAILRSKDFLDIFDRIICLIETTMSHDVKEYSKKVDDLLKDVVYRSLDKGLMFNLDQLIDAICTKLRNCKNNDGQMVLIKWIETLHSITNVNILMCVPRFLEKLFKIVEKENNEKNKR
jgi:vacuole morphology and inheritance protein 14